VVALAGAAAATGLVPWTAAGVPVIAGGAVAVVVGLLVGRRREPTEATEEGAP
jgi:ABC-type uncharacterized transport system permease subunit